MSKLFHGTSVVISETLTWHFHGSNFRLADSNFEVLRYFVICSKVLRQVPIKTVVKTQFT